MISDEYTVSQTVSVVRRFDGFKLLFYIDNGLCSGYAEIVFHDDKQTILRVITIDQDRTVNVNDFNLTKVHVTKIKLTLDIDERMVLRMFNQ